MTPLLLHGEGGWVSAQLSVPVPWRGAGSSGVEHPYSNHVRNVLISAWLDLFSSTAVTRRQQLWRCENSQTVSCLLLPVEGHLAGSKNTGVLSLPESFLSLTHISPGHICCCCRDHIKRIVLHVPLPHVPGLPAARNLWVKVAAISWSS